MRKLGSILVATLLIGSFAFAQFSGSPIGGSRAPGRVPGNLTVGGKVTSYNGTPTAGSGVSPIRAYGSLAASTANGVTIASFTVGATNGVFEAGGAIIVTAYTSGNISIQVNYTDCEGTPRSYNMFGQSTASGSGATTLSSTGVLAVFAQPICAQAGSTITLKTANSGTATADFYAFIRQVN